MRATLPRSWAAARGDERVLRGAWPDDSPFAACIAASRGYSRDARDFAALTAVARGSAFCAAVGRMTRHRGFIRLYAGARGMANECVCLCRAAPWRAHRRASSYDDGVRPARAGTPRGRAAAEENLSENGACRICNGVGGALFCICPLERRRHMRYNRKCGWHGRIL